MTTETSKAPRPGFGAVVKEDVRRTLPLVALVGAAAIVIVAAIGAVGTAVSMLAPLCFAVSTLIAGGFVTVVQLGLAVHFYTTMVGREAPFVRTWPVSGRVLLIAKLAAAFAVSTLALVLSVAMVVTAQALVPPAGSPSVTEAIAQVWNGVMEQPLITLAGAAWLVAGVLTTLIGLYFSVLVGSRGWLGRLGVGGPILVSVAVGVVVSQGISVLGMLIPLSLNMETLKVEFVSLALKIFELGGGDTDLPYLPIAMPVLQVVLGAVLLWWCARDCAKPRDIA